MVQTTSSLPGKAPAVSMTSADFPALQRDASRASRAGQTAHLWLARVEIIGVVAAAVFGSLSSFSERSHVPFALGTVLALLTAMVANFLSRQDLSDRAWFDGRAVAESVKTSAWRYMMRVEPYQDDATCNRAFAQQLLAILNSRPELRHELSSAASEHHQITARMREARSLPLKERIDWYLTQRVLDQVEWYRAKADANRTSADHWFWASLAAQVGALAAAVLSLVAEPRVDIVGVLATASAAATAWANLRRHEDLSKTYGVASQELLAIADLLDEVADEDEFGRMVTMAEGAISREHTMWIARRADPLAA